MYKQILKKKKSDADSPNSFLLRNGRKVSLDTDNTSWTTVSCIHFNNGLLKLMGDGGGKEDQADRVGYSSLTSSRISQGSRAEGSLVGKQC